MTSKGLLKRSFVVALTITALVAGDALAQKGRGGRSGGGGGGGGGGSSWSGGGGGRSGGGSSSRSSSSRGSFAPSSRGSFSGGSGSAQARSSAHSFSQSGGSGSRSSWSGGGGGGRSAWSGGGGGATPRSFSSQGSSSQRLSNQAMQSNSSGSRSGDRGPSSQFRGWNQGNTSAESRSAQLRAWSSQQGPSSEAIQARARQFNSAGSGENPSSNRHWAQRPDSDQVQAFLNRRGGQSAGSEERSTAARQWQQSQQLRGSYRPDGRRALQSGDGGSDPDNNTGRAITGNPNRFRGAWPGASGQQALGNQLEGLQGPGRRLERSARTDSDEVRGRGDGRRSGDDDSNRSRRGSWSGNSDVQQAMHRGEFRRGDRGGDDHGRGRGDWGKWSKKDDRIPAETQKWFGRSGFGDHRGRSDRHGHHRDHKFADHVRKDWHDNWWKKHWRHGHGRHHVPFGYSWWVGFNRPGIYLHFHNRRWYHDPYYWWGWPTAPRLTTWVNFGWNYPCYWDYGPGEYITYYNNVVYVDGQRHGTSLEYYAQVRALARSVPPLAPDQLAAIEWLPMGVFAVTRQGSPAANELLQIAVSSDGVLSGTLFDQATGTARPLQGMVDQATQRAAWSYADAPHDGLVVETSLYNLTEPQCTALAHLGPVTTEVWQLVRIEQPAAQPAPGPPPAVPAQ